MKQHLIATVALVAVAACGGKGAEAPKADSAQRDLAMAPADTTAALNDQPVAPPAATPNTGTPATRKPPAPRPVASTLAAGTMVAGTSADSLNSRHDHAGGTIHMTVGAAVKDAQGRVVIPAGSVVALRVYTLGPAENDNDHTGKLKLTPVSVTINGTSHALSARVDSVKYAIVGRGVTAGDAAKVGAGAVVGGLAGRVIGGNKRGAVVGAVAGAAAGAAVASKTNDRDVVIKPGDYIRIALTGAFGL
ncbi:MAG TPA: glycine zipper 2TM domain-containing protein, partial [Gemmatimonadales bacterium]|nr:glycine zipper 2TM domain-containing protein [Gemmatimonadales bacterium]